MELDEMKTAWSRIDEQLAAVQEGTARLWKEAKIDKTRKDLQRWSWLPGFDLAFGIVTALVVGSFLADNISMAVAHPLGASAAIVLFTVAVFTIGFSVWQLATVNSIDYSDPVVEIQKKLLQVKVTRIRATQLTFLLGLPLWVALPVLAAQLLVGFDAYLRFSPSWIIGNLAFGAVVSGIVVYVARKPGDKLSKSKFWKSMADDLAGRSLSTAMGHIGEVSEFAEETAA